MNVVNFFKALSDETRLRLVYLSLHYELNVNELVSILGMGQSRISRHLKILTDSKLLKHRRDGLWSFYSSAAEGEGHDFIQSIRYLFDRDPGFTHDLESARRIIEERSLETVRFFDSIAEDWEKLKREIIGDANIEDFIGEALPASGTIVDLGCGTGDLLMSLTAKAQRVIGVEKSPRMLETARKRFLNFNSHIDLRIGELEYLPVRDGEADAAVINMVLHHLVDPQKALREVHRILKSGDAFVIVDLVSHQMENMRERYGDRWLGFSTDDIHSWLGIYDFAIQNTEYFNLKKGLKGFLVRSIKK